MKFRLDTSIKTSKYNNLIIVDFHTMRESRSKSFCHLSLPSERIYQIRSTDRISDLPKLNLKKSLQHMDRSLPPNKYIFRLLSTTLCPYLQIWLSSGFRSHLAVGSFPCIFTGVQEQLPINQFIYFIYVPNRNSHICMGRC